ncbi:hypothetical protein ASPWEDRAFT_39804 [Aspergillus wentii DTO 134E9]|uniref:F-box domain-containing protein n=1 Tax=Aspergillus wentii DTO 134E9 TaxID=1073089 RepID=A0A1L9RIL6_ASPWE|nr:uncharacterized protein ASPWEDRAFT_39804 [Aspergillus wentii DTO 134E9]OJJ34723.1 hypothetical protein ASPWEDRAFT_39804 [Aspergillus wentii DTO 134E9]
MTSNLSFLGLPPEIHLLIAGNLCFPDILYLKMTNTYFYDLIPKLSHSELLLAEESDYALERELYTCRYCLRLRPAWRFADRMHRRRRSLHGRDVHKRFCVECGLKPRDDGNARYGPGAQIVIQGCLFVICIYCKEFGRGAYDRLDRETSECERCYQKTRYLEKLQDSRDI